MNQVDRTAPDAPSLSPRLLLMRDSLVGQVANESTTPAPRRLSGKTLAALVAAFVVAGSVTGGLTAAAAISSRADAVLAGGVAATGAYDMTDGRHGNLIGSAVSEITTGSDSLALGAAPAGANAVAIGFQCVTAGNFTVTFASAYPVLSGHCGASATQEPSTTSPAGYSLRVDPTRGDAVNVTAPAGARYAVWASWAKVPTIAKPSAAQLAEVADGTVTRSEYVAAFGRYEKCMAAAGYPLGQIPANETNFQYALSTNGVAVSDTRCYPREFEQVDDLWQSTHPQ